MKDTSASVCVAAFTDAVEGEVFVSQWSVALGVNFGFWTLLITETLRYGYVSPNASLPPTVEVLDFGLKICR
jgi:hypothetical protein